MFTKVLIANRGEIACRIIVTLKKLGIRSVAVYSDADAHARHVREADEAVYIGQSPPADSYLRSDRILSAAKTTGAEAVHPGYGFLSENADFAGQCAASGIVFIGPEPDMIRRFGLKHTARAIAEASRVPLLPGSGLLNGIEQAACLAESIGYPVMLKSTAGGGGIGMRMCRDRGELQEAYGAVMRLGSAHFTESGLYLEKYVRSARHIEVQIFGDGQGRVLHLGERDCSVQRRNQKVIEETPAPNLSDTVRESLFRHALALGEAVNYRSAGTVEFVYDEDSGQCYFLEVNTRLQVEHGVTEAVTGVDLVEWMLRLAAGETYFMDNYRHGPQGTAVQARVYAEDPNKNFQPSTGLLVDTYFPGLGRVDHWLESGMMVTPHYDPLLAKIIVHADDRRECLSAMESVLGATRLAGIETNLAFLRQIVSDDIFRCGKQTTSFLSHFRYRAQTVDVLDGGTQSMIQDYPGRLGYWDVGVPPSGPMDPLAFRLANRILGNPPEAAGLEMAVRGPTLKFNTDVRIALAGAAMAAEVNGEPVPYWCPVQIKAGDTLKFGGIAGPGCRTYLAIRHGFDVPRYLGSRSTFTLGKFGGHGGRTLRAGDVLAVQDGELELPETSVRKEAIPRYRTDWSIGVLYGPHGAPDFFTEKDIEQLFSTGWEVHYNSNRTGIRLIGPKPQWARPDGGEAGLHPSNIHDNAYAVGTVDFTGDMPVILGPDGPSLGGFVCPATVVDAELWKLGQLKPGDSIRFQRLDRPQADALAFQLEQFIDAPEAALPVKLPAATAVGSPGGCVLEYRPETAESPAVTYRQAGDRYLLVEYGPIVLDLNLRFRVHALTEWLRALQTPGIVDLTPGIRSLQIHYDQRLSLAGLMDLLGRAESEMPAVDSMEVPSRIVHLPLSWNDPSTQMAIEKYMQSVRKDAPWCPSNIEFIRRINGLDHIDQVRDILFDASYLVLGLGDVYLGAPVATPVDPRHRLVTTKYNPARTWTPENAVGIGGAYLCIYGMEGPGGYQFVGRTIPMWNHYRQTDDFKDGKPWLLRFFDQIRFFPVSPDELLHYREGVIRGGIKLDIREETFSLKRYNEFLHTHEAEIAVFKARQQAAFEDERESWSRAGHAYADDHAVSMAAADTELDLPESARPVVSHIAGNVWKVLVKAGDRVSQGEPLIVVESMKMEFDITAPFSGRIWSVFCTEGGHIAAGQDLLIIRENGEAS
ncbi:MAG: urea carboxylase [Gammaproteobacteria bacterium]